MPVRSRSRFSRSQASETVRGVGGVVVGGGVAVAGGACVGCWAWRSSGCGTSWMLKSCPSCSRHREYEMGVPGGGDEAELELELELKLECVLPFAAIRPGFVILRVRGVGAGRGGRGTHVHRITAVSRLIIQSSSGDGARSMLKRGRAV